MGPVCLILIVVDYCSLLDLIKTLQTSHTMKKVIKVCRILISYRVYIWIGQYSRQQYRYLIGSVKVVLGHSCYLFME